ncbi:hypothetical protein Ct61P_15161 [Colletotrichum tofieldiae]|nr:hypothetical protein Ct61P_15161 [Colletotrichum tofieldiae]
MEKATQSVYIEEVETHKSIETNWRSGHRNRGVGRGNQEASGQSRSCMRKNCCSDNFNSNSTSKAGDTESITTGLMLLFETRFMVFPISLGNNSMVDMNLFLIKVK